MDEAYGAAGYLLDMIHLENKLFFAEIQRHKQAWRRRPKVVPSTEQGPTGRPPTLTHLALDAPPAQRVDALAAQLRLADLQRFNIHEGSKGPQEVEIAVQRVATLAPNASAGWPTKSCLAAPSGWCCGARSVPRWRSGRSTARVHPLPGR